MNNLFLKITYKTNICYHSMWFMRLPSLCEPESIFLISFLLPFAVRYFEVDGLEKCFTLYWEYFEY